MFCVCGDMIDIFLVEYVEMVVCVELFDDEVEMLQLFDLLIGCVWQKILCFIVYLLLYYVMLCDIVMCVVEMIKDELCEWFEFFYCEGKFVEVQCFEQCMCFDFEMLQEFGFCKGIENYLWYFLGVVFGDLLLMFVDYLLFDVLMLFDELYVLIGQFNGMYNGDCVCKENFVNYGFCLLLVFDNWLLKFYEFECKMCQVVFVLVMLVDYEKCVMGQIVEQVV